MSTPRFSVYDLNRGVGLEEKESFVQGKSVVFVSAMLFRVFDTSNDETIAHFKTPEGCKNYILNYELYIDEYSTLDWDYSMNHLCDSCDGMYGDNISLSGRLLCNSCLND